MRTLLTKWRQFRADHAALNAAVDEYERAVKAEHDEMVAAFGEDEVKRMRADGRYRSGVRVEAAAQRSTEIYESLPWWQRY